MAPKTNRRRRVEVVRKVDGKLAVGMSGDSKEAFAKRINPRNLGFSPKLTAIVGAILGHDYGVRDGRGGLLTSISITSDGFVIAGSTAHESGAFIGDAADLDRNLEMYLMEVASSGSDEDAEEFRRIYAVTVKDWRAR